MAEFTPRVTRIRLEAIGENERFVCEHLDERIRHLTVNEGGQWLCESSQYFAAGKNGEYWWGYQVWLRDD